MRTRRLRGLAEAGIRAVYAHGVPVGAADWWSYSSREHPEDIRRIRKEYFSVGRSAADAGARGARAGQHDAGGRDRTIGSSRAISAFASACTSACG